jgi:hypothetical protein
MLTLLFVGTEVSESLNCDHIFFILFYLLCGLAGGLFAVWFSRAGVSTVGASGSVSGMIVALSVLRPNSAVAILGDVNASSPLLLLAGTLLADLQRLGVSWQVRSHTACSAIARVIAQCFILRAFILRLGRGISAAALQATSWPLYAFGGCEQWRRESEDCRRDLWGTKCCHRGMYLRGSGAQCCFVCAFIIAAQPSLHCRSRVQRAQMPAQRERI